MPSTKPDTNGLKASSKKRKHAETVAEKTKKKVGKKTKAPVAKSTSPEVSQEDLLELEEAIVESPTNYNKIVELHGHFQVRTRF